MSFLDKLDFLMSRQGLNLASLARESGIPYTTLDGFYKKGYSNTKLSTLQKLCDFFGVTLDYLVKDDIDDPSFGLDNPDLAKDEAELLSIYRTINDCGKECILNIARVCLGNPDMKKEGHCKSAM